MKSHYQKIVTERLSYLANEKVGLVANFSSDADESEILQFCRNELDSVLAQHAEFADFLEDIDAHICSRTELVAAMKDAPHAVLRQALFSTFVFREVLTLATGRKFV